MPASTFSWDQVRQSFSREEAALGLGDFPLPGRVRVWARRCGITNLGELAAKSSADLLAEHGFGVGTVDALRVIDRTNRRAALARLKLAERGLLVGARAAMEILESPRREAVIARSGIGGAPVVYRSLAAELGVSAQRVSGYEGEGCQLLADQAWARVVRARLEQAAQAGTAGPGRLAQDRWWAGIEDRPWLLVFLAKNVLPRIPGPRPRQRVEAVISSGRLFLHLHKVKPPRVPTTELVWRVPDVESLAGELASERIALDEYVTNLRAAVARKAMAKFDGSVSSAARWLKMDRATLRRLLD